MSDQHLSRTITAVAAYAIVAALLAGGTSAAQEAPPRTEQSGALAP